MLPLATGRTAGRQIANPCVLARISHEELDQLFRGYGYTPYFVEGNEPEKMHELMAATLDKVIDEIHRIQADASKNGVEARPRWRQMEEMQKRLDRLSEKDKT